ncbi:serine/threonine-protein kinase SMG1-like protein [Corchorus capsularis]|uniref:Serine/threonine-protein kinase SMG1-like protein n=1 Tax=Corchorus capsularis TaxID=210143 RepID=A0A1R3KLK4_COCAP|nr:serine/threonine-protein kinase SMG1-like protein [Corchorus capsularis]
MKLPRWKQTVAVKNQKGVNLARQRYDQKQKQELRRQLHTHVSELRTSLLSEREVSKSFKKREEEEEDREYSTAVLSLSSSLQNANHHLSHAISGPTSLHLIRRL